MNKFVHLNVHSSYSFQSGFGLPEKYIKRAKELGQSAIAITDTNNISSHYKWYKLCNKESIKPILGVEISVEGGSINLLVKNITGYHNLMELVTDSWHENPESPVTSLNNVFKHQKGLIVLSGGVNSPFMNKLKQGKMDECDQLMEEFDKKIDDFYIEIQPIESEFSLLLQIVEKTNNKYRNKLVATNNCHYILPEQSSVQEVLQCIKSGKKMDDPEHPRFEQTDFYLKTREEMEESFKKFFPDEDFTEAMDNTVVISELVDFEFPKAEPIKFPVKGNKMKLLREMCYEGMVKRGLALSDDSMLQQSDNDKTYKARLERELDLVDKKGFVDYFLVIADLIQWAKREGILVGPARGSAAGSLACYALAITEVEPIRYGLIFERFIDINRADLPDIDIDFEDVRRHEVKKYLEKKYGIDKVGTLPTFAEFQGKSAIGDVGGVFNVPYRVQEQIKKAIIVRSGGDSRASFTLEDTFNSTLFEVPKLAMIEYPGLKYAIELEGQYRQMGQHAAGVVVSNEPINDFCALYKMGDNNVTSLDYKDVTDIGLLKIDVLGLNTLSVVSEAVRQIKKRHKKVIDVYNMPLDDAPTYKGFCDGKLFGVFQFDGQAVNQVCRQIMPKEFEALSAISALARPGPLNSGNTTEYIMRRAGKSPVTYVHPIMESITGDSYGIVIYQEQVMRIMREIGKMSWEDTSTIRKMMSRSLGVEAFNAFKARFMPGALENGLSEPVASKIWEEMCHYGSWSFNKSHSVSYSVISYWTMWLKIHYPIEFYGAILALTPDDDKRKKIIKEYKREGGQIDHVDINKSQRHFSISGKRLIVGLQDIYKIGEKAADVILKGQPYDSYTDFEEKTKGLRIGATMKQGLVDLGAFDGLVNKRPLINLFGETAPEFHKSEITFQQRYKLCPWDMEFDPSIIWKEFIEKHPETFKTKITQIKDLAKAKSGWDEPAIIIWGMASDKNLRDIRETSASKGKTIDLEKYNGQYEFANFVLEDSNDFITVRISYKVFPKLGKMIFENTKPDDVIMVKGRIGKGIRMFFAEEILNLRLYKEKIENVTQ